MVAATVGRALARRERLLTCTLGAAIARARALAADDRMDILVTRRGMKHKFFEDAG
jgi:hypothetical protein